MEQHPIPREITSFQFKLIGFMTLHQFLYLVVFFPIAYIVYRIIPIPVVNILLALIVAAIGGAFAFLPIQDRPLDIWLKNLWKRLNSPTQYTYHKNNPPIRIVQNLFYVSDPHKVSAHIESREKLSSYLARTQPQRPPDTKRKAIQTLITQPSAQIKKPGKTTGSTPLPTTLKQQAVPTKPFLTGTVNNNKKIPLPGILIYIKDTNKKPIRLLKTNPHGVFATFHPIEPGTYVVEPKDPKGGYFFDTMKLSIDTTPLTPLRIQSKEIL